METISGVVQSAGGGGHALRLPFQAKAAFGRARATVRVVAEGRLEFTTTLAGYGGISWLGLRKDQLAELGLQAGDPISVTFETSDQGATR